MEVISPLKAVKIILERFCDSVGGKPRPSAPVNFLTGLTAANPGIYSVSLSNL